MQKEPTDGFPVFLERRLKLQSKLEGDLSDVVIQVGYPVWVHQDIEASCPVTIHGVEGRTPNIRGVDPMDAMKNAMIFIEGYLTDRKNGIKFFGLMARNIRI